MNVARSLVKWLSFSAQSEEVKRRKDMQPTVEWQVNGHCNYDCVYCIQSRKSRVGTPDSETITAIVGGLAKLPGTWEIKMSGGEVFAFKGFIDQVIPELVQRTPHHLSVLTNFSAPIHILKRFSELTGDRLRVTSASLHPDTADVDEFVAKAIEYRESRAKHNPHSSFVVNVVLVPGKVSNHFKYREILAEAGFRYFPQLMKIRGGVYPYNDAEKAMIEQITGGSHDPMVVNRAPSYQGMYCEAGKWYFIVDQKGEAYTCRTGKKYAKLDSQYEMDVDDDPEEEQDEYKSKGRLGSFVRGDFQLFARGGKCPYPICPCTVPVNRGIVHVPADWKSVKEEDVDA